MSFSFNWRGLRGEVAAGVSDALGQTASQEAYWQLEERNRKAIDDLASRLGETVTNEDVRDLLSRMNFHLIFSGSIMMKREDAVKIVEVLCNQDMEIQRLRKVVKATQDMVGTPEGSPMMFCGVELEEAIDRVENYPKAMDLIPKACKTCWYRHGPYGEMYSGPVKKWDSCRNREDGACHWKWDGESFGEG